MRTTKTQHTRATMSLLGTALVGGALLGAVPAGAHGGKTGGATETAPSAEALQRYDLDRNGKLDTAEKAAYRRDLVEKIEPVRKAALRDFDWNKNGVLDPDERLARQKARQTQNERAEARALRKYDANHDGTLDAAEQAQRASAREAWLLKRKAQITEHNDANGDGVLDATEKAAIRTRLEAGREKAIQRYDLNGDGRLDASERAAGAEAERRSAAVRQKGATTETPVKVAEGAATLSDVVIAPLAGARRTRGAEIGFALGKSGAVTIRVYDAAGRLVRTVTANETMSAGPHKVRWDGSSPAGGQVSNGLYLISVEAFGQRATKKLAIVK
jgi:Ca2+-binding EF-hand superfamily protein